MFRMLTGSEFQAAGPATANELRVIFVGESRGTSPSLDLTFPPTGLSENLGGWKGGGEGKGKGKGGGDHLPYFPPLASASNTTLNELSAKRVLVTRKTPRMCGVLMIVDGCHCSECKRIALYHV